MKSKMLLLLLGMLVPLVESIGLAKENEDPNDTGIDDVTGEGLVYLGQLGQYLIDTLNGKTVAKPAIPDSLQDVAASG